MWRLSRPWKVGGPKLKIESISQRMNILVFCLSVLSKRHLKVFHSYRECWTPAVKRHGWQKTMFPCTCHQFHKMPYSIHETLSHFKSLYRTQIFLDGSLLYTYIEKLGYFWCFLSWHFCCWCALKLCLDFWYDSDKGLWLF